MTESKPRYDGHLQNLTDSPIEALHGRQRRILGEQERVKAAVFVPLVRHADGQWSVLFERRARTLRRQAGEVCFPGGHCDPQDADERAAALRETSEELGLPLDALECVADLDVLVTWSRLLVYPFIGYIHRPEEIRPNTQEVDEVFEVSLAKLLQTAPTIHTVSLQPSPAADFPYHMIPNGRKYAWRTADVQEVFYEVDGRIIWGMTARILTHALNLIRAEKGDDPL